jgi:hypothetical protein
MCNFLSVQSSSIRVWVRRINTFVDFLKMHRPVAVAAVDVHFFGGPAKRG